jgi:hypothetical protein
VLGILLDRAWAVQQLAEISIVGALGMGVDSVDGVIRTMMEALSASRAIWAVVRQGLAVVTVVLIITAAVAVIVAPVFTTVIVVTLVVSGAGNQFGFFGVGVSVCCLYQFADGCGPLAVQLARELLMSEPFGESGDGFGFSDVGNKISCL